MDTTMTKKLAGKVAFVTGAPSGIGEATAVALAEAGAHLAVLARRADRLEQVVERIKDIGGEAVPLVVDVTNEVHSRAAIRRAKETFGRIDILVNNAGVMLLHQIEDVDTGEWRQMLDINVLAAQHITDPQVRKAQQEAEHSITPLRGEDIAAAIVFALTQPEHVSINELLIRPTKQV
jgi:NADP-dependent 3-hydroxy acid dehydrogenase YdfG